MEALTKKKQSLHTICAQADHPPKDPYGSHTMPLYQTSTFRFKTAEAGRRYFAHEPGGATHGYSRLSNPTVERVEEVIAKMEGLDIEEDAEGLLFGSGMAAITTAIMALASGKRVLAQETLYGCTSQFLNEEAPGFGIGVVNVDPTDISAVKQAFMDYDDIAVVYLESVANPTMRVSDIEFIATIAHDHNALLVVDNTFATPYHLRPLTWGADLVAHSTTKYLNGHGSVVGGALAARKGFFEATKMRTYRKNFGGISGPFDAWLTLMGLKTFPLRMKQHDENGRKVAAWLRENPAVKRVCYIGDPSHPDAHTIRKQITDGFGGMIAFELKGGIEAGRRMMDRVKLCTLAVSLGTVDTLIQHPASMTHSVVKPEIRESAGITDGLVRLSVGIESADDIISDLQQSIM
ncbi:MAG: PLP-dependent transferase [Balneolaceae bacterium]|nr:MAG: PLP-dependent transferase [Balneolaceae bacterium]